MNLIKEVNKPEVKKTIVIYGGRFQPFHRGHYDAYQRLVSQFGEANVYIASSNDTSSDKSPFTFKEKKEIATTMFGVPASKFVKVSNPYRPVEILGKFDGKTTAYIAAVGEKDATRLQGKYFKPYNGKSGYGYDEIGYTYPIPPEPNPISGTQVRKGLGSNDKEKAKKFFLKAYPKFDREIFKMITTKLNEELYRGYPSKEDVEAIEKKNKEIRAVATTDDDYVYDPISEIIQNYITNEMFEEFTNQYFGEAENPALDVDITYTNSKGQQKKIKARDALRLPKEHPAHIQAAKIAGPADAPANQPKKKEEPGKAATQAAKPSEPGQPTKQGQTTQGKIDKEKTSPIGTDSDTQQGPPPEQKLSGVELKSDAEKNAQKEKSGNTKEGQVKRIQEKVKNWSKEEKQTFSKLLNKKEGHDERRSWGQAIMDKAKGAGHAIMHGLKHEYDTFKTAGSSVKTLMAGGKLDDKQKKALKSVGIKIATTALFAAVGGGLAHGAAGLVKHTAMELIPHAVTEVVATGVGKAAIFAEDIDEASALNIFAAAIAERIENMDITPEIAEKIADSWNNKKMISKFSLNENLSETKQQSIQHFVEFATKRLKLKETPNVTLVGGREFAEVKTSLGGYNPEDKSIYVATEGRLTADILRTLAHEMVHRKQDELGLVRNLEKDGADGSPIENQAHAVAGILMREYGRINKQIYNENVNETIKKVGDKYVVYPKNGGDRLGTHDSLASAKKQLAAIEINKEDVNVDVDTGDTILMGKFKNKKVQVKDIGKDDHGMPTINGRQATTFRKIDEMGSNDVHFKNLIDAYKNSTFRKRINAYLFGNPNGYKANDVARSLRNMGYDEITKMEKELNIKPNFDEQISKLYEDIEMYINEISGLADADSQADGAYLPKGHTRKLDADDGVNKGDDWYYSGGYTQMDFPIADAIWGDEDETQYTVKYSARNLPRFDEKPTEFLKEGLLMEGGAYGHMSHPFDDMDLTFGHLKDIVTKALNGDLGVVREKTDGQALAISWKNGRLIAARNKGHLSNGGASAMGIEDVASKFGGRGGLTDAYNYAMKDLSAAVSALSQKQREKVFGEGTKFMNIEVIWPTSVNVIPYGQALLVFHNCIEYDEKGNAVGKVDGAESVLAGMIKQVNADVQSKYTIQGPPITEIPKSEDLSSKQSKYLSKISKLQSEFGLKDSDNVADYHQSWWDWWITSNAPVKVDKLTKEALIRRWAFGDKSFRLNTISNPKLQDWAMNNDKVNVAKQQKDNIKPFEEIFLGVGADVLEFVGSVLTVHPDKAIRSMKSRLKTVADQVKTSGNPAQIQKLKQELSRLNRLGGIERIVANEGLVFFYNGKTYKLTGTFAPLNQILGIFYE
jgi:cytidyltransferase-like protein